MANKKWVDKFILDALDNKLYHNFYWLKNDRRRFVLHCKRKNNKKWRPGDHKIFEDYKRKSDLIKMRKTDARQLFLAALNKSKYLKRVMTEDETNDCNIYEFMDCSDGSFKGSVDNSPEGGNLVNLSPSSDTSEPSCSHQSSEVVNTAYDLCLSDLETLQPLDKYFDAQCNPAFQPDNFQDIDQISPSLKLNDFNFNSTCSNDETYGEKESTGNISVRKLSWELETNCSSMETSAGELQVYQNAIVPVGIRTEVPSESQLNNLENMSVVNATKYGDVTIIIVKLKEH